MDENESISREKIKALSGQSIDYPGSPHPDSRRGFSLERHDHVLNKSPEQMDAWDKTGAPLFAPAFQGDSGARQFQILRGAYQTFSDWLGEITTGNAVVTWRNEQGKRPKTIPLPTKAFGRKICSEVFNAFNPEHAYGQFVQVYLQALADALELGDLSRNPPVKSQPRVRIAASR